MNADLEFIEIPEYPSGSYNFIRRLRNIPVPEYHQSAAKRNPSNVPATNGHATDGSPGKSTVKLQVAIIGAGVGGLSNAIALKQAGHDVVVYEQASALSEVGAGIQIPPNSTRILHSWGLKAALQRRSVIPSSLLWRRWEDGAVIGRARLNPESVQRYGSPYYVTHRAHLHDVLHERTKELCVPIHLKKRVQEYDVERGQVTFVDGEVVDKDLVIAADGLKSLARRALNGAKDKGPQGHGLSAYRGTVSMADIKADPLTEWIADEPNLNLWVGHDRHVMAYMISGGEQFNVVLTHPQDQEADMDKPMPLVLEEMRSYYQGWDPRLTRLLEMVTSAVDWPIHCIEVPEIWASQSGKLVITGDAAHAMVPYMALGAAMAVEDAAALAATLAHVRSKSDLNAAVARWVEARQPRVRQIHATSFGHGLILHLPDGSVQRARDEALRPELDADAVEESPDQWNDPVVSHAAYTYDAIAEIERLWAR